MYASIRRWFEQSSVRDWQIGKRLQMVPQFPNDVSPQPCFDVKLQSSETRASAETPMRTLGIWMSWSMPRRNSRSKATLVVRQ